MRLIGLTVVALICFALVALLVENREGLLQNLGLAGLEQRATETVFETGDAPLPDRVAGAAGVVEIPVLEYGRWIASAGFADGQTFDLALPARTPYSDAVIELDVTATLEEGTTGRLRIGVNGEDRGQIVLNSGISAHKVRIPLRPIDKLRNWVSVSVSAIGNNPKAECTTDWTGGVVVTVEPTSRIVVGIDEPVTNLVDRLLVSGSPVRIVWGDETDGQISSATPQVPWPVVGMPGSAVFVDPDEALDTDVRATGEELLQLSQFVRERDIAIRKLAGGIEEVWPVHRLLPDTTSAAREFRNRATWQITYDQALMPDQQLPDQFHFDLTVTSSDATINWLLAVILNGRILHSERISPEEAQISRDIALPSGAQKQINDLRITLTSDEEKIGRCVQGRPAAAQLEPSSNLDRRDEAVRLVYSSLLDVATNQIDVYIAPEVGTSEANSAFYAISQLFRQNLFYKATAEVAEAPLKRGFVAVATPDRIARYMAETGAEPWRVWVAFSAVTDAVTPETFTYRGDDPALQTALEVYQPPGVLLFLPPGFQI